MKEYLDTISYVLLKIFRYEILFSRLYSGIKNFKITGFIFLNKLAFSLWYVYFFQVW